MAWRGDEEVEIERARHRAKAALLTQYNALDWLAKAYPPDKDWSKKAASRKRGGNLREATERQLTRDAAKEAGRPGTDAERKRKRRRRAPGPYAQPAPGGSSG